MREWQAVEDPPSPRTRLSPEPGRWRPDDASLYSNRPRSPDRGRGLPSEWEDDRRSIPDRHDRDHRRSMGPRSSDTHKSVTDEWAFVDNPPPPRREMRDERPIRELRDDMGSPIRDSKSRPYSMDRRPRFTDELPEEIGERDRRGRRYGGERKRKSKWTEITKDLVVREAIERSGYEFEETELIYHVFAHLEYVSCLPHP